MKRSKAFSLFFIASILFCLLAGFEETAKASDDLLPGTYRCSSYNVSGGAGSCRNMPTLKLQKDGTYRHSSTHGRWSIKGGKLFLSESKLWGLGEIIDKDAIRFEYDYRGLRHTVTWRCKDCEQ